MLEDKIILTPEEILEHEFKIDARGYRPQEVDKFLDIVIRDYVGYDQRVKKLQAEIKNLMSENEQLRAEVRKLRTNLDIAGSNKGITNVDIIKRLSELEKAVYGEVGE